MSANNYYPILGDIAAYRAGLITYMPEGQGEKKFDAESTDVIPQGKVCILDLTATPPVFVQGDNLMPSGNGQVIVSVKEKIAGEPKVVGVGKGFRVLVESGGVIPPYGQVDCDADGNVVATVDGSRAFAQYTKWARRASSNDGNHALAAAADGDLIEITIL